MSDFWQGLVSQVSAGLVCIAVLLEGLAQGFCQALSMVWSVAMVDSFYIVLPLVGISDILQAGPARKEAGPARA